MPGRDPRPRPARLVLPGEEDLPAAAGPSPAAGFISRDSSFGFGGSVGGRRDGSISRDSSLNYGSAFGARLVPRPGTARTAGAEEEEEERGPGAGRTGFLASWPANRPRTAGGQRAGGAWGPSKSLPRTKMEVNRLYSALAPGRSGGGSGEAVGTGAISRITAKENARVSQAMELQARNERLKGPKVGKGTIETLDSAAYVRETDEEFNRVLEDINLVLGKVEKKAEDEQVSLGMDLPTEQKATWKPKKTEDKAAITNAGVRRELDMKLEKFRASEWMRETLDKRVREEERNRIARNSTLSGRNFIVENVDVPSTPAEFHALKRERLEEAIRHRTRVRSAHTRLVVAKAEHKLELVNRHNMRVQADSAKRLAAKKKEQKDKRQGNWLAVAALAGRLQHLRTSLLYNRATRGEMKLRKWAAVTIATWFKQVLERALAKKTREMILKVGRLMDKWVHVKVTKIRRHHAAVVGGFLQHLQDSNRLKVAVQTYYGKVVKAQRLTRSVLLVRRVQEAMLLKQWLFYEQTGHASAYKVKYASHRARFGRGRRGGFASNKFVAKAGDPASAKKGAAAGAGAGPAPEEAVVRTSVAIPAEVKRVFIADELSRRRKEFTLPLQEYYDDMETYREREHIEQMRLEFLLSSGIEAESQLELPARPVFHVLLTQAELEDLHRRAMTATLSLVKREVTMDELQEEHGLSPRPKDLRSRSSSPVRRSSMQLGGGDHPGFSPPQASPSTSPRGRTPRTPRWSATSGAEEMGW